MAYLSAVSSLDNVIQYEIDDPTQTIGGPGGGANAQAQALLNRTKYIYDNFFNRLTQTLDNIADGTSYRRVQAALADAINNQTRLPTALGTADANAIAAATGATLYARLFGILDATWALGGQTPAPKTPKLYTNISGNATETLFTLAAAPCAYLIYAVNNYSHYYAYALAVRITTDYVGFYEIYHSGSLLVLSNSGADIKAYNGYGATETIEYYAVRLGY